jgi:hypothetical protein
MRALISLGAYSFSRDGGPSAIAGRPCPAVDLPVIVLYKCMKVNSLKGLFAAPPPVGLPGS